MLKLKWTPLQFAGRANIQAAILLFLWFGVVVTVQGQTNPANFVTIREKAGVTTNQYPIQFGRPFVQGEIKNFPQAVVGGLPVVTQADVKSRWPDGSVKHAVLTSYLPKLNANGSVKVTFINQLLGNTTGFLTKKDMLHKNYNFDARMELTNGAKL